MTPLILICAYLLGSVPFGIVITRALGLGDLRTIGSGNIGATNVLRTGHKGAALATLILDGAKGGVAVLLASALAGPEVAAMAGLAAFIGHLFPVWLGFNGGKGVATFLGIVLALAPLAGLLTCLSWLAAAGASRISSVGALTASALAPIWLWLIGGAALALPAAAMAAAIWWSHRANIGRLARGEEPKINLSN